MKKRNFKFSIIMSMYNAEDYLKEAIDSLINQTIGFEENVELILVNDGSIDNSEEICKIYKNLYPNNIKYIKKANGGLPSAKNKGLEHVSGEYINFFDSDDILSKNTLEEVYNFFERNKLCVDFVSIPLYFFEAETGLHPKYAYMGKKNRIINLINEPYNFVLSGAACFYKKEVFKDFKFDESYVGEEDTLLNGTIYLQNPRFGYVCQNDVKYNYRKRFTKNSIVDKSGENPDAFITVCKLLDNIIPKDNILNYHKELIIYELRSRFKKINKSIFKSEKDYNNVLKKYYKYVSLIDTYYLVNKTTFGSNPEFKKLVLDINNVPIDSDISVINSVCILKSYATIRNISINNNEISIDVTFNKYGYDNLELCIFDEKNNVFNPVLIKGFDSTYNAMYGNFKIDITHLRRFTFALKDIKEIKFILKDCKSNMYFPLESIKLNRKLFISGAIKKIRHNNYVIRFKNRKFVITKRKVDKLTFLKMFVRDFLSIAKRKKKFAFLRIFNRINKKYILINDRALKAGDNGEALFRYICQNEPELTKYTYFVISKNSPDFSRLKKFGKVVALGSLKHKLLFLNASHIYSSHTMFEYFNAFDNKNVNYYKDLFNYKFIWLQHGITKDDISYAANQYSKKIDFIIAATNSEYNAFISDKYMYDKNQVLLTGFSRFDLLENEPNNIITLAPTWRRGFGEKGEIDLNFEQSDYYKNYAEILSNKKLKKLLEEKSYTLNFLLHPEMINYKDSFKKFQKDNVINIIDINQVNYSKVFKESKLFITDFSSTFFDFAYLKKPEIFFQFDRDKYFETHYKVGYFDYKKDAFGDVLYTPEDVIDKIIHYFKNDFKMEQKYIKRVDKTFKYNDKNNCKRIIDITYKKR